MPVREGRIRSAERDCPTCSRARFRPLFGLSCGRQALRRKEVVMTRARPVPPGLEYHRKQAKALLKALAAADSQALARFRRHHPRLAGVEDLRSTPVRLADAQLVIAR